MENVNVEERKKLVVAMEYIARQTNNEQLFYDYWLSLGIPDDEIKYGLFNTDNIDNWYIQDAVFSELMGLFLTLMYKAKKSGGLYCDNIVSE